MLVRMKLAPRRPRPGDPRRGLKKKVRGYESLLFPAARRIVYKKRRSNKHEKKTRESYGAATTHVDSFKIGWWWKGISVADIVARGEREGGVARRGGRAHRRRRPSVSSLTLFSPRRRLGKYAVNSVAIRTGFNHHQTCFAF